MPDTPTIAVFTKNRVNPAYAAARLGAERAAARLDARIRHYVPDKPDDIEEQTALVDRAIGERPDAVVFVPVHATAMNASVGRLNAAGIPAVNYLNRLAAGEFVSFEPTWSWPKPVQKRLPVLIGGAAGPKLFEHIADYADGWAPIGGRGLTEALPVLRERVAAAGRDPSSLEIVPLGTRPDHGKLDHFEDIGVTECVFDLPSAEAGDVELVLDRYAVLLAERRG